MQKPSLHTVLSPALLHLYDLPNSVVVIIDVFRATSTIASALFNGAEKVIPVAEVEECKRIGATLKNAVTAGERNGQLIEGLLHGNSPSEYNGDFIKGKTLVLTTTNGTKMLHMSLQSGADEIVTGSFPNLNSIVNYLSHTNKNVILACSGWKDKINIEDTLFAGAIIEKIKNCFTIHCDSSLMAQNLFNSHHRDLKNFITKTTHWHRLSQYGLQEDMLFCVTENNADVLPFYNKVDKSLIIKKLNY